jgi:hypothetical protein
MRSFLSAGATYPRPTPLAERTERIRPFDGWMPESADITMDPLDRVVGRAFVDVEFRAALLANPAAALAAEPMALSLKRALVTIRATSLEDFARRSLEARLGLGTDGEAAERADPPLTFRGVGSLAGVGV